MLGVYIVVVVELRSSPALPGVALRRDKGNKGIQRNCPYCCPGLGLPLMPVSLKLGKITFCTWGGEHSPILMKFRSAVFCPMISFLALGARCLWGVGISLYWHSLLSLLGRTLPAKMPHLATKETPFICKIVSITINLFSHSLNYLYSRFSLQRGG